MTQGRGPIPMPDSTASASPCTVSRRRIPEPELAAGLWLLTHPDLRRAARVRAFLDFVGDALMKEVDTTTGAVLKEHTASARPTFF
jgi:DNA-binding transcriptional LysR family regulator